MARLLLPDPETPVMTTTSPGERSRSTPLRLCVRAPASVVGSMGTRPLLVRNPEKAIDPGGPGGCKRACGTARLGLLALLSHGARVRRSEERGERRPAGLQEPPCLLRFRGRRRDRSR